MSKAQDSVSLSPESSQHCEVCGKLATQKITVNAGMANTIGHFFCDEHGKIYWDAFTGSRVHSDKTMAQ